MPRTRDYFLMIVTIAALTVAIGAVLSGGLSVNVSQRAAVFVATEDQEPAYSASVVSSDTVDRSSRLQIMREKIASLKTVFVDPAPVQSEDSAPVVAVSETPSGEERCDNYQISTRTWNASGLIIEEVEGARLIYRAAAETQPVSSSTAPRVTKAIALQLPVRSIPATRPSCISSDVIGVATDGSLIRNDETRAYRVFDETSLVGYALDGFPIYGVSSAAADRCGGLLAAGQYRYVLSTERDTIINCYAGSPASL